ncbi:MAG: PEP-CTERM sorting domain-containing protein [Phycisphaerales bacterium]
MRLKHSKYLYLIFLPLLYTNSFAATVSGYGDLTFSNNPQSITSVTLYSFSYINGIQSDLMGTSVPIEYTHWDPITASSDVADGLDSASSKSVSSYGTVLSAHIESDAQYHSAISGSLASTTINQTFLPNQQCTLSVVCNSIIDKIETPACYVEFRVALWTGEDNTLVLAPKDGWTLITSGSYNLLSKRFYYENQTGLNNTQTFTWDFLPSSESYICTFNMSSYAIPEPATLILLSLGGILLKKSRKQSL